MTAMLIACGAKHHAKDDATTSVVGSGSGSAHVETIDPQKDDDYTACLRIPKEQTDDMSPYVAVDPTGQGRLLEGFGVEAIQPRGVDSAVRRFGRMDQFKEVQVDATKPNKFSIDKKTNALTLGGLKPDALKNVEFTGVLRCPSDPDQKKTLPVVVKVIDVNMGASDVPKLPGYRLGFQLVSVNGKPVPLNELPANAPASTSDALPVVNALCGGASDGAFAIPGYWDPTGTYQRDDSYSFICAHREAARCIGFGYSTEAPAAGKFDFLQACGRMMTADYCGNGATYTIDGTEIGFYDTDSMPAGSATKPAKKGVGAKGAKNSGTNAAGSTEKPYEGAWDANGLICKEHPRRPEQFKPMPKCEAYKDVNNCISDKDALAKHPAEKVMIFSTSCKDKPCMVPQSAAVAK